MTLHSKSCLVDAVCESLELNPAWLISKIGHDGRERGFDPCELTLPLAEAGWATLVVSSQFTNIPNVLLDLCYQGYVLKYVSIHETEKEGISHAVAQSDTLHPKTNWLLLFWRLEDAIPFRKKTAFSSAEQTFTKNGKQTI